MTHYKLSIWLIDNYDLQQAPWSYVQGTMKTLVLDEAVEIHDFSV